MEKQLPQSMQNLLEEVRAKLAGDEKLIKMFENCYTNTLDTTVKKMEDGSTYVITGDIPAMWLRDSVCQLRPYYVLAEKDPEIADMLEGLVKRQMQYILIDAYANAFNEADNGNCWEKDETEMSGWIWERKYEIDSLCFPVQMSYLLWKNTGRTGQFDEQFVKAIYRIIEVFRTEQDHENKSPYNFIRKGCYYTDTLSRDGKGALVKSDIGLTWSGFRPSDDACMYGYLIPSNMFAEVIMGYVVEIATEVLNNAELAKVAAELKEELRAAIEAHGTLNNYQYGKVYAYEVDGFGQYNIMDDANLPSLLSIPYIGYVNEEDETYKNTRKMILSEMNPYFYKGTEAQGIGSPHTPVNYIWHISLAMQGLTSNDMEYKKGILEMMKNTDGGKELMHEGFNVDDPAQYTREWFSWANAMFCELVLDYCGYKVKR
ncbi:MAG: glycoside hydrolase family 125 protein [Niameybacter sp.]|uniref:glycoside hydrolase family 125 protein n=1 Tax=Niameybacter sp. TaxID=2033640 RepID=UPI002FCC99E8